MKWTWMMSCLLSLGLMACSDSDTRSTPGTIEETGEQTRVNVNFPTAPEIGDAAAPAAREAETSDGCSVNQDCEPFGMVCDQESNQCTDELCEPGLTSCWNEVTQQVCSDDGKALTKVPCPADMGCFEGECSTTICEPGSNSCEDGMLVSCDTTGTRVSKVGCPGDNQCIEGACRPILHNVILLFDTSYSMNDCIDSDESYTDCCPSGCPSEWPVCETADNPLSKLGYSKKVYQEFFTSPSGMGAARYALLTFPQTPAVSHSFCDSGYWYDSAIMTGDDGSHVTSESGWFMDNVNEVIRVPISPVWGESNVEDMLEWVDFVEVQNSNLELRASGSTPLGKSMFYAGEYIRHFLVVEGKACATDADCGSQDYICSEGSCTDPIAHCRQNILLVFTDGKEANYPSIGDFFNPVVQARRFQFGLGCQSDEDCLNGALCSNEACQRLPEVGANCTSDLECPQGAWCTDGQCVRPGFEWPENMGSCSDSGKPCDTSGSDCGFFVSCDPVDVQVKDPQGANVLRAYDGSPIPLSVHVIDVSNDPTESKMIAAHGGGRHFDVSLADTDILLEALYKVTDIKYGVECIAPEE